MTRNWKALAFDLDGTLLNENSEISPYTLSILKQAKEAGYHLMISTGRNPEEVKRRLSDWKAEGLFEVISGFNGSWIIDLETGQQLHQHQLPAKAAVKAFQKLPGIAIAALFMKSKEIYSWRRNPLERRMARRRQTPLIYKSPDELSSMRIDRLLLVTPKWQAKRQRAFLQKYGQVFPVTVPWKGLAATELAHPLQDKMEGIRYLLQKHELKPEEVLAFGDDWNDELSIRTCTGICPANALPHLKKEAWVIVESNREDGPACFIERNLL